MKRTLPINASAMDTAKAVVLRARFSLLLGYYADMIFVEHPDAFVKTMNFLFDSLSYPPDSADEVITF